MSLVYMRYLTANTPLCKVHIIERNEDDGEIESHEDDNNHVHPANLSFG